MDDKGGILNQCKGGGLFNQAELEQLASRWVNTYSEIKKAAALALSSQQTGFVGAAGCFVKI